MIGAAGGESELLARLMHADTEQFHHLTSSWLLTRSLSHVRALARGLLLQTVNGFLTATLLTLAEA